MQALSQTPFAHRLLSGPIVDGIALGHGHFRFGDHVLSLTRPGAPKMPNGIECDLPDLPAGAPVRIGQGALTCAAGTVFPGPIWDPRPRPRYGVTTEPRLSAVTLLALAGQGPGLTPLGDDILAGYFVAGALCDGVQDQALAESLVARTTSLSSTLLHLAAGGALPEAAHHLLEDGDPEPLLDWGATSGSGLLVGLGLCGSPGTPVARELEIVLPLSPPRLFRVEVHAAEASSSPARMC